MFGIKLETKVMPLHKKHVELISSFLLNKYAVHGFCLLPVMFKVQPETSSTKRELAGARCSGTFLYS